MHDFAVKKLQFLFTDLLFLLQFGTLLLVIFLRVFFLLKRMEEAVCLNLFAYLLFLWAVLVQDLVILLQR